jgi:hypothetical protein
MHHDKLQRGIRRRQLHLRKRRVRDYWACSSAQDNPVVIGKVAAHPVRCSKPGCCGNLRRKGGMIKGQERLTVQERRELCRPIEPE